MRIWISAVYNWKLPVLCGVSEQILFQYMGRMENLPDRQYPGAAGNLPARTQVYETEISELESERECRDLSAGYRRQYLLSDLEGERKTVGKRFRNILAVELSAAAAYLFFISYSSRWGWNYAAGYMMVATVFIEYICCREVIQRYWRNELDQIMEQTESFFQKRLEQALEIERKSLEKVSRSDQLRVDLITNVSHDLKTPLTSIVGYLELIKKEELSDVVRDYVDVISTRAGKLGEMINSLFSLAKASSGNVELHKETFELNRLMEQIFADMDDRIKESGLKFVTQFTEEDTAIYSDNSYFYRICQNLIENALKYSAKGTRVFVKTYKKEAGTDQKMVLEITNTSGYEMDFEKEDIIERFSRGDKARTSEGNGLGLAIVSTYAKALGGEFDIKIDCDQFKAIVSI